jgi:endonuclease/exonuclease/phosphatase family metal-dependent hydrolase
MPKRNTLFLLLLLGLAFVFCAGKWLHQSGSEEAALRVMTFNIRLNTPEDALNAWPHRKTYAASMIQFHRADLVGLQEVLRNQLDDLTQLLPDYGWFGVGRDDGKDAGEFSTIFYRKDRCKVLEQSTFWLAEKTDKPGKGWDANCYRVVTWGKFQDLKTGKVFYHFNTHFDHRGVIARRESAKLLLRRVAQFAGGFPVIVTGDFNSTPDSEPYQILTLGLPENPAGKLVDTESISLYPHHGPQGTVSGWNFDNMSKNNTIDYVFVKNNVKSLRHGTLSDNFDGRFPSDHMPVLAELKIE